MQFMRPIQNKNTNVNIYIYILLAHVFVDVGVRSLKPEMYEYDSEGMEVPCKAL